MLPVPTANNSSLSRLTVVLVVYAAQVGIAFYFGPIHLPVGNTMGEQIFFQMRIGVAPTYPLLLAVFAALGPNALVKQIQVAVIGLILLAIASEWTSSVSFNRLLEKVIPYFGVFLVVLVPLGLLRQLCGLRVTLAVGATENRLSRNQFSMRWLFLMTAVVAVIAALFRYAIHRPTDRADIRWLDLVAIAVALLILLWGFLLFVYLLLADRGRLWLACRGIVSVVVSCALGAELAARMNFRTTFQEMFWQYAGVTCGTLSSIALTLLPLRWCGYRLVRGSDQAAVAAVGEE
jgi:hypothetical protein